jgi:hypothetical protein
VCIAIKKKARALRKRNQRGGRQNTESNFRGHGWRIINEEERRVAPMKRIRFTIIKSIRNISENEFE